MNPLDRYVLAMIYMTQHTLMKIPFFRACLKKLHNIVLDYTCNIFSTNCAKFLSVGQILLVPHFPRWILHCYCIIPSQQTCTLKKPYKKYKALTRPAFYKVCNLGAKGGFALQAVVTLGVSKLVTPPLAKKVLVKFCPKSIPLG